MPKKTMRSSEGGHRDLGSPTFRIDAKSPYNTEAKSPHNIKETDWQEWRITLAIAIFPCNYRKVLLRWDLPTK